MTAIEEQPTPDSQVAAGGKNKRPGVRIVMAVLAWRVRLGTALLVVSLALMLWSVGRMGARELEHAGQPARAGRERRLS